MSVDFVTNDKLVDLCQYTAVHFDVRYPTAALALARLCIQHNIPYSVDVERPREGLEEILRNASIVICNSQYCRSVDQTDTDTTDTTTAASPSTTTSECLLRVMAKQAPNAKIAIQTMGSQGSCLVFTDETLRRQVISHHFESTINKKNANMKERKKDKDEDDDDDSSMTTKDIIVIIPGDDQSPTVTLSRDGTITCGVFRGGSIVDTTGAGDAFIGGFLTTLWTHYSLTTIQEGTNHQDHDTNGPREVAIYNVNALARALRIGSRVASKKMEKSGARNGLPTMDQDEFLQKEFATLFQNNDSTLVNCI
jgi:sugar/nucleoside kinase (ribokinase family)